MNSVELETCAFEDATPPNEIFGIMTTKCFNEQQSIPTQDGQPIYVCDLAVIQPNQGGIFRFIERRGQQDCTFDELATHMLAATGRSTTVTVTGLVSASNPDLSASAVVSGTIELSGGNCREGTCPLTIHMLELTSDQVNAVVDGSEETATNLTVVNTNEAEGTCLGSPTLNACLALLEGGSTRLFVSAETESGERKAIDAINVGEGGAIINYGSREVFITGTFTNGDTTVEFGVAGTVDNLAPRIDLPPPIALDCGTGVTLQADIDDVDGDPARAEVTWFVDGRRIASVDQNTAVVDLPVGTHEVFAVVTDEDGGFDFADTTVTINPDTTPPQIIAPEEELCLWPPDHRRVLIEPSDLGLTVVDECDPSPSIELVSATSSQPDNGAGDGNTTGDVSVGDDAVCLRAERQGADREGRRYAITARARDSAGNVSSTIDAVVRVPHSMPFPSDCRRFDGERVSESDPRCLSSEPGALGRFAPPSAGGGSKEAIMKVLIAAGLVVSACGSSGSLWKRRRRRRRGGELRRRVHRGLLHLRAPQHL